MIRAVTSSSPRRNAKWRQEVEDDVIVVAGEQRDPLLGAGLDHAPDHVQGAVAVEGRDLDRDHVVDRGEAAPERGRQARCRRPPAADRSRSAECAGATAAAVGDQLVLGCALEGGEAEQPGVIAEALRRVGLAKRLPGAADQARDQEQRPLRSTRLRFRRRCAGPARRGPHRESRTGSCARRPRGAETPASM